MASPDEMSSFSLMDSVSSGPWAPVDFADAEDSRPTAAHMEALGGNQDAIQGIVQQTLSRHITEVVPPQVSPQLSSYSTHTNNWRKRLREMMIRQNETVLNFLFRPASEHAVTGPVEQALRRYAIRQDIDVHSLRNFKDCLEDLSGYQAIHTEIEGTVLSKGPSTLPQIRSQVNALIELYKETGEKLLDTENQLKMRLEKIDKIQRRVSTVIELQTNEGTPDLVEALENYMKISFRDMQVESIYKSLLHLYLKHITLREAILLYKTSNQLSSEPLCPICITESVGTAITPCGHTFCHTCARRMVNECGVCRGRIKERIKLYFS
jgi:uncharacterized protein (DUF1697 family)